MINFQKTPYKDEEIFASLNKLVSTWFKNKFGEFSLPQKYAVMNIHNKENTLITAPTGSGKTLSAFLAIINELTNLSKDEKLEDRVYCLYISPLKALNYDIQVNLKEPLKELATMAGHDLGIRVAVRTGDTTQRERAQMLNTPPHILITTPESLALMLTAPKFRDHLSKVQWAIIDEVHALAVNKRGVDLSLSLERLQEFAGNYTRIGLSATISPLEEVAKYLVGLEKGEYRSCKIVDASFLKKLDLKVISPVENIIQTTETDLHDSLYNMLDNLIQEHKTTLIFTNTRAGTERVIHHLKTKFPEKYIENIDAHHSSLSKSHRFDTEERLRKGKLKVVVTSSSLELGVDIGYIDLVIQMGSPKSVTRALQRFGRAQHKLKGKSKGRFVVLDRDDLVECSVMLKNAVEGKIDKIDIPKNCLDVLAQHIYGEAIVEYRNPDELFDSIKQSYCYQDLQRSQYEDILSYLAGEYVALEERHVYAKIFYNREDNLIGKKGKLARVLYSTNIGTIPDESHLLVKIKDQVIGTLDEGFLERLKPGDVFILGGATYQFQYARGMTVQVRATPEKLPTVPSWFSDMLPLSYDLAMEIQKFRLLMEEKFNSKKSKEEIIKFIDEYLYVDENAANSIYEYFREQYLYAEIPHKEKILIEFYKGYADNKYVIFHTLFGRRVNDALSRAIAYEISRLTKKGVSIALTDNGFYLTSTEAKKIQALRGFNNVTQDNIKDILIKAIDNTEILKRRFRHCAGRALMILRNYKGVRKQAGRQQVSAMILLKAVKRISDKFPILEEARREVIEDLMDIKNAKKVLKDLDMGRIKVKTISTDIPSPFALNLIARGFMDVIKMEDKLEFIRRMHKAVLKRIENN
ncbi:MAG: ATP-dependent helicase [Candidatus Woesearchaeota archaeon]